MDDIMPIRSLSDSCAVVMRSHTGQHGDNCQAIPVREGMWQFDYPRRHRKPIRLCAQHAAILFGNPRLTLR